MSKKKASFPSSSRSSNKCGQRGGRAAQQGRMSMFFLVLVMFILWCWCAPFLLHVSLLPSSVLYVQRGSTATEACRTTMTGPGVPTFKHRDDLGDIIEAESMTKGLELGVQYGYYSNAILTRWPKCTEYHLVDIWAPLENYVDFANKDQREQDEIYNDAMERLRPYKKKIHVCRNFTKFCASQYQDDYFDFIYVDARHDFKGVTIDLENYWPKLKVGGIIAGHDYVTNDETGQNWTVNYDGTIDLTGTVVKGAVDAFAMSVCRQVTVSYRESEFNTWAMRK